MRGLGAGTVEAALGPCIHPECYAFGPGELDRVAARLGDGVRARTATGELALDLPAAVEAALASVGVPLDRAPSACTACAPGPRSYSHRARAERERQALVLWLPTTT
jgi:copper oxidase (laccase) domain-containing protein